MAESSFETLFAGNAARLSAKFGESITYNGDSGAQSITAIVNRESLQESGPSGARIEYRLSIWVQRSDVATPKVGQHTVSVSKRPGSSAVTMAVTGIIEQTGASWHLALN